jgi:predicted membrane chloride channel (bestrophin family)
MTVEYDPNVGTVVTALQLKNTVITQVLHRFEFYVLIAAHFALRLVHELRLYSPEMHQLDLPLGLTGVTGSLMTFFVVFYNGNVFIRYNKFYDITKQMNENCLNVVMMLTREISNQALKRKLVRMLLASCFLFFFERTPTESEEYGSISNEEWAELVRLGLLDEQQELRLKDHCRDLTKNSMPSLVLLHWSMKLYRLEVARNHELDKAYWEVRRMQDDVVEMLELPMPWQYFHIMNMMMMLNLMLWAYSFAFQDSYFASLIFVFVAAIFMGIRELCVALADPYGDDAADFPLNEWMNQLYVRVNYLCEDNWSADEMMHGASNEPLPEVKRGTSVVDLLTDIHQIDSGRRLAKKTLKKRASLIKTGLFPSVNDIAGNGNYIRIPVMPDDGDSIDNYAAAD